MKCSKTADVVVIFKPVIVKIPICCFDEVAYNHINYILNDALT